MQGVGSPPEVKIWAGREQTQHDRPVFLSWAPNFKRIQRVPCKHCQQVKQQVNRGENFLYAVDFIAFPRDKKIIAAI